MNTHSARLTSPALWAHHAPATEKDVAGFRSPLQCRGESRMEPPGSAALFMYASSVMAA